jgi:hypothetical protein
LTAPLSAWGNLGRSPLKPRPARSEPMGEGQKAMANAGEEAATPPPSRQLPRRRFLLTTGPPLDSSGRSGHRRRRPLCAGGRVGQPPDGVDLRASERWKVNGVSAGTWLVPSDTFRAHRNAAPPPNLLDRRPRTAAPSHSLAPLSEPSDEHTFLTAAQGARRPAASRAERTAAVAPASPSRPSAPSPSRTPRAPGRRSPLTSCGRPPRPRPARGRGRWLPPAVARLRPLVRRERVSAGEALFAVRLLEYRSAAITHPMPA